MLLKIFYFRPFHPIRHAVTMTIKGIARIEKLIRLIRKPFGKLEFMGLNLILRNLSLLRISPYLLPFRGTSIPFPFTMQNRNRNSRDKKHLEQIVGSTTKLWEIRKPHPSFVLTCCLVSTHTCFFNSKYVARWGDHKINNPADSGSSGRPGFRCFLFLPFFTFF